MTTYNCLHWFHPMADQMSISALMAVSPFPSLLDFASGIFVFNLNHPQLFHSPSWFPEIPPTLRIYSGIHGVTLQLYVTQAAWRTSQPVSYMDNQQAPAVWTARFLSPYTKRVLPPKSSDVFCSPDFDPMLPCCSSCPCFTSSSDLFWTLLLKGLCLKEIPSVCLNSISS